MNKGLLNLIKLEYARRTALLGILSALSRLLTWKVAINKRQVVVSTVSNLLKSKKFRTIRILNILTIVLSAMIMLENLRVLLLSTVVVLPPICSSYLFANKFTMNHRVLFLILVLLLLALLVLLFSSGLSQTPSLLQKHADLLRSVEHLRV